MACGAKLDGLMKESGGSKSILRNHRHCFIAGLLLFSICVAHPLAAQDQPEIKIQLGDLAGTAWEQRIYFGNQAQPCATLRTAWLHKDFERRGFFRIGLFPLIAMETFQLDIPNPGSAAYGFAQIQSLLKTAAGGSRIELRNVRVSVGTARVVCGRVRFAANGDWELLDGVSLHNEAKETHAAKGIFHASGPGLGTILLKGQSRTLALFSPADAETQSEKTP